MTRNTGFQARLARIEAKTPVTQVPARPAADLAIRAAERPTLAFQITSAALGLALLGGVVAFVWEDISFLFPAAQDGRTPTYLESALYNSMSEEEIERMNADPRLEGMSAMQKMILSH